MQKLEKSKAYQMVVFNNKVIARKQDLLLKERKHHLLIQETKDFYKYTTFTYLNEEWKYSTRKTGNLLELTKYFFNELFNDTGTV